MSRKPLGKAPPAVKKGSRRTKICRTCRKRYPAAPSHFHRYAPARDGLASECRWCQTRFVRAHYVSFSRRDLALKGPLGAVCPLWNDGCGRCTDVISCWRFDGDNPDDLPYSLEYVENDEDDEDGEE